MVTPEVLVGPRLKVKRAEIHIAELCRLTQPLSRDFFSVTTETELSPPNLSPDKYILWYRPTEPIAELLALIVGDAIHNFRAALDHLCTGILRTVNPSAKGHFPMHPARESFVSAPVLSAMEEALPGTLQLITDEVRPESGPDEHIWRFNSLDNDDKHNLILPAVTIFSLRNLSLISGSVDARNVSIEMSAVHPLMICRSNQPIHFNPDFTVEVDLTFGTGVALEGEPVIETLTAIGKTVTDTINAFDRLIQSRPISA